jgi:hypothetical protein
MSWIDYTVLVRIGIYNHWRLQFRGCVKFDAGGVLLGTWVKCFSVKGQFYLNIIILHHVRLPNFTLIHKILMRGGNVVNVNNNIVF